MIYVISTNVHRMQQSSKNVANLINFMSQTRIFTNIRANTIFIYGKCFFNLYIMLVLLQCAEIQIL